jgi:hypothetical protein
MSISKNDAEIKAERIVSKVLEDKSYISELLKGVISKEDSVRYPIAIALEILCEKNPEIVYPKWNSFVDLLKSENAYHKSIVISVISNLTSIDGKKKLKRFLKNSLNLLMIEVL